MINGGPQKKLIIQMPCYNEEGTLAIALGDLPREVPGFSRVEWLVIDDGSTDNTVEVARECGVDHIISHSTNRGLATTFMTGVSACLERNADVIVNTDADNQYNSADIPKLTQPVLDGEAEIVVGARPIENIGHFSKIKKLLQKLGSWAVRKASGTEVPDAPSGFRAMSRQAAMQLNVFNPYTYTLETIIQAGRRNIPITSVPVRVNDDLRPSRLVKSIPSYIKQSLVTIVRIFVIYKPFRFFGLIGLLLFGLGFLLGLRFLVYFFSGDGGGHVQSLILSGVLLGMGFQTILVAFLSDLLATNRRLMEEVRYRLRRQSDEP
jgi:glycosyltransferase involved in cell wall biosynthesis